MVDTPEQAINAELDKRTEAIAATAAAQIEQANKDAEAIARAAQQSEHVARVNELEGRVAQWRTETENRLATIQTETMAKMEALQSSILSKLPPSPPVTTVVTETPLVSSPTVNPENEGGEQGSKSKPTEPQDENHPETSRPVAEARRRVVL